MDMQAFDLVRQLSASQYLVRSLHVVAELGVADVIGERPLPVAEVAARVGADADALGRVLRLLASRGIFTLEGDAVGHSDASGFLTTAHPASLRDLVLMFAQPIQWDMAGDLLHAVRTGEAVASRVHPNGGFWGYFEAHPEHGRGFAAAMTSKAVAQIAGIVATHDFARYGRVVDVGGSRGHMLRAVLARHPEVRGTVFDLPPVIEEARVAGSNDRLDFAAGDFFASDIPAGDCIMLMEILHDWDDAACHKILGAVRRAAKPETRLLVIETEVPEGNTPDWSKLLDIIMLAAFAAKQRTAAEYGALLAANGFALTGQADTGAGISIFEARPV